MPRQKMLYIELKSNSADQGPAWIGLATLSGSGRTIYFNGKALKRIPRGGISGNYYDLETGEEYWISGVKKDGSDRHWTGGGVVMVDSRVLEEYLSLRGLSELNSRTHQVTSVDESDISRFHEMENETP